MPHITKWIERSLRVMGGACGKILPTAMSHAMVKTMPMDMMVEGFGSRLNRPLMLDDVPFDLALTQPVRFEQLAGLFASTPMDHGVILMTIRQAAYLFGLVRSMPARTVIEIGRYKGGQTVLLAAAMPPGGRLWSIDNREKEPRLHPGLMRSLDTQVADGCKRFDVRVELLVGDSRTLTVDTGEVDLVVIDGDHTDAGVWNDCTRWGKRVRRGGAVIFSDACEEGVYLNPEGRVGRVMQEILAQGEFRLVKVVNRLAHLERVRASAPRLGSEAAHGAR